MTPKQAPKRSRRDFLRAAGCTAMAPLAMRCSTESVDEGRVLHFTLDKLPHLALLRGMAAVMVDDQRVLLIRASERRVVALSGFCTHVLCDMSPEVDGRWDGVLLTCQCHGSQFDIDGNAVTKPALQPLARYPTTFDAETGAGTVALDQRLTT